MRQPVIQVAALQWNRMIKKIIITGVPEVVELLHYELQNGFYVETESGIKLISFLTGSCGIPESYIRDKVKTIFHNGNPVDDPASVKLRNDSVVAISGAMPGIVGAMMRMASPYAAMRESITEKGENIFQTGDSIHVMLKLFNVILGDLWRGFVEKGVILDRERILRVIGNGGRDSHFIFKIDNEKTDSSKPGIITDEKYIIIACD